MTAGGAWNRSELITQSPLLRREPRRPARLRTLASARASCAGDGFGERAGRVTSTPGDGVQGHRVWSQASQASRCAGRAPHGQVEDAARAEGGKGAGGKGAAKAEPGGGREAAPAKKARGQDEATSRPTASSRWSDAPFGPCDVLAGRAGRRGRAQLGGWTFHLMPAKRASYRSCSSEVEAYDGPTTRLATPTRHAPTATRSCSDRPGTSTSTSPTACTTAATSRPVRRERRQRDPAQSAGESSTGLEPRQGPACPARPTTPGSRTWLSRARRSGIDREHNGLDLRERCARSGKPPRAQISIRPRVGVAAGRTTVAWRFWIAGRPAVSR